MIEHIFEPTGYYAEDGFVPPSASDRTRAMKEAAEMVAKHTPWWVVKRDTGTVEVHKQHRGPASDFCVAAINQWDDHPLEAATRIVHCVNLHDELVEALEEARLQIEYIHGKFKETGTGNAVLAKISAALSKAKGE